MKALVIKSNHGNHRGFNRKWTILAEFDNHEEAEEFLEECMAVVVKNIKEVKEYLDESGMDVEGMSKEEADKKSISLAAMIRIICSEYFENKK